MALTQRVYGERLAEVLRALQAREQQRIRHRLRVRVRELGRIRVREKHAPPLVGDLPHGTALAVQRIAHLVAEQAGERGEKLGEPPGRVRRDRLVHEEVAQQRHELRERGDGKAGRAFLAHVIRDADSRAYKLAVAVEAPFGAVGIDQVG